MSFRLQFNDFLLICRTVLGGDYFNREKIYKLPIEDVRVTIEEHEDHECEFSIISSSRSNTFLTK